MRNVFTAVALLAIGTLLLTAQPKPPSAEELPALQETQQQAMHAKAYYGLARIALLEQDPATADRFFRKILELEPDPATKAWALVYIGKLSDSQGEKESAQENYKAALAVQGISDLARQEAQRGLTGAFARNPKSKEQE